MTSEQDQANPPPTTYNSFAHLYALSLKYSAIYVRPNRVIRYRLGSQIAEAV